MNKGKNQLQRPEEFQYVKMLNKGRFERETKRSFQKDSRKVTLSSQKPKKEYLSEKGKIRCD